MRISLETITSLLSGALIGYCLYIVHPALSLAYLIMGIHSTFVSILTASRQAARMEELRKAFDELKENDDDKKSPLQ